MKVATALCAIICATGTLAAPGTASRRARAAAKLAARGGGSRSSNPKLPAISSDASSESGISNVEYSGNWAGAVLVGSGYTSVTGTAVVPTVKEPSGGSSRTEYWASAWVGIDGDTCDTAILQTGFDVGVENGKLSFDAWYEWYPDYAYDFSDFDISAGDQIKMTVTATSKTAGSAVLENLTTGKTVTQTFSSESTPLCEENAEWIVEDFEQGSSLVPFADFGTITFTDASVTTSSGTTGVSGATIIDIEQNNKVLTNCSTSGSSTVTCEYV